MKTKSVYLIIFLLILLAVPFSNLLSSKQKCKNCNVILISVDSLRKDALGVYGNKRNISPNIDALAKKSLVFENVIATAPSSLSSHMSIFTGHYPESHGMFYDNETTSLE